MVLNIDMLLYVASRYTAVFSAGALKHLNAVVGHFKTFTALC